MIKLVISLGFQGVRLHHQSSENKSSVIKISVVIEVGILDIFLKARVK